MRRPVMLGCSTAIALSGCAVSIGFTPTNQPPHALAQKTPAQVELHTVAPNDRSYVDIGLFQATIDTVGDDQNKVLSKLRTAAARRGCDALITDMGHSVTPVLGPSVDTEYRATCIVYR